MTPTPTPTVILTPAPPAPQRTRTEYHDPTSETESHRPAATLSGIPLSEADQRYIDAWFEHDAQLSVLAQTLKVSLIELARWATQPHIQDTLREIGDAASLRTSTLRAEARHAAYARLHDITLGPDLAAARKAADRILRMDWLDARKANPAPGATAPSSGRAAPLPSSQNPECQQALGLASRPTPEPLPEGGVGVGSFDPPTPAPGESTPAFETSNLKSPLPCSSVPSPAPTNNPDCQPELGLAPTPTEPPRDHTNPIGPTILTSDIAHPTSDIPLCHPSIDPPAALRQNASALPDVPKGGPVANYFLTIPASDACIEFMRRNPDSLESFCAGEQPEPPFAAAPRPSLWNRLRGRAVAGDAVAVPSDWPTEEADLVGEINHRNVDLYHWVLNGTPEPVPGAGSVFQTWFADTHDAIDLFDDNERFAFDSGRTRELHRLAVTVTRDQTGERFRLWLAGRGHTAEVSDGEVDGVWEDFAAFRDLVGSSVERGWGLIWVPS